MTATDMAGLRAAIYGRYSSDLSREESIEDQERVCRQLADRHGWSVVAVFHDAAISGASAFRPDYQRMLDQARLGMFDVLVAEGLDRLSRDQCDVAALFKQLSFYGIGIVTLAEGAVSELHVGLKGTMNALFLKDLAAKTHRGLRGRVEGGKSAGGLCYGYRAVRKLDDRGEQLRGDRVIDPDQRRVVLRIFEAFAAGASPIAIAKALNVEGVPGPGGGKWQDTTIRGHVKRGTGILRNELYLGTMVWNRMRFIKDPATGRRVSRMNPPEAWLRKPVPELTDRRWRAVGRGCRQRLGPRSSRQAVQTVSENRFWERRTARHMLTGKAFCGVCGGALGSVGKDYLSCTAARRQGTCTNRKGVRRAKLDEIVLGALQSEMMEPALFRRVRDRVRSGGGSRGEGASGWGGIPGTRPSDGGAQARFGGGGDRLRDAVGLAWGEAGGAGDRRSPMLVQGHGSPRPFPFRKAARLTFRHCIVPRSAC